MNKLILLLVFGLLLMPLVSATTYMGKLFVDIDDKVDDDMMILGGIVELNDNIEGDVIASGASVTVNAPVKGDLIITSGTAIINESVEGNVYFTGSSIQVTKTGEITKDLSVIASTVKIDGTVEGDLNGKAGNIFATGELEGNNNATPLGLATWWILLLVSTTLEWVIAIVSVIFQWLITVLGISTEPTLTSMLITFAIWTIGLFIAAYVFVYFQKKAVYSVASKLFTFNALLYGVTSLVVIPIIIFVLLVSTIGIPLMLVLLPLFIAVIFMAFVFVPIAVGEWINKKLKRKDPVWLKLAIGVIVVQILFHIPQIGIVRTKTSLKALRTQQVMRWNKWFQRDI